MGNYVREISANITNNHNPAIKPMIFFDEVERMELSTGPIEPPDGWIPIHPESMASDILEDEPEVTPQSRSIPRSFSGPGHSVKVISGSGSISEDDGDLPLVEGVPEFVSDVVEQYEDLRDVSRQLRSGRASSYPQLYTTVFGNSHTGSPTAC
jgi:hypothetical protein